jgi:hypothetical protein
MSLCSNTDDRENFELVLRELTLSDVQKQIIQTRYINILENFRKRVRFYSRLFIGGHFLVTVGSLFVPALLSIQNSNSNITMGNNNFSAQIYWATFIISLLVTICNGVLTLFKIDKKYYFLHTTLERLRTEGWQYMGLTGRYSGRLVEGIAPTHDNQFVFFTHQVEKIKMKQVEEEYYKTDEKITQNPPQQPTTNTGSSELYPRSPEQPIHMIQEPVPDPVKDAVNTIIRSQKTISVTSFETDPKPNDSKPLDTVVIEV